MKITAEDLKGFGIVDGIIEEPVGGAHRDPGAVIERTGSVIADALKDLSGLKGTELRNSRREKISGHRPFALRRSPPHRRRNRRAFWRGHGGCLRMVRDS